MELFLDEAEEMTPEQRLAGVAAILTAGYRRLRQSHPFTEKPLDCASAPLPLCGDGPRESAPAEVKQ
jgi:hypothetical protein